MSKSIKAMLPLFGFILISSCAHGQKESQPTGGKGDVVSALKAAGFQERKADTPEKTRELHGLTQNRIVAHESNRGTFFTYADGDDCGCVYVGDVAAYERFQKIAVQRGISDRQRTAVDEPSHARIDWDLWNIPAG